MPIGKDSITKRVAKVEPAKAQPVVEPARVEENIAPELVATTAAAPKKAPAKKTDTAAKKPASTASKSTSAKKPASTTAKKPAAKKPASEKPAAVNTGVLSNVAPETVEAVIGHKEDEKYEKVSIGDNMPTFLL